MDVLRLPIVGAVLSWRPFRSVVQGVMLVAAATVVLHGLVGPDIAPRNLATVLTSIHWRGLLVVSILVAGNLFCTACPMVFVRDQGRRFWHGRRPWPKPLRGKWPGLVLLVAVLFVYEQYRLWSSPAGTAALVLAYFGAALAVDLVFKGASFCKHLCPIGQFNFVASTMAPTELTVRDPGVCRTCHTADCVRGRHDKVQPAVLVQRGCELGLFLPAKLGNLDCTLCLDCVRACPRDNVALAIRVPGQEWLHAGRRSGIGRLAQRPDLAVLALVFTYAALLGTFSMTPLAARAEAWLEATAGVPAEYYGVAMAFLAALGAAPVLVMAAVAGAARWLSPAPSPSVRSIVAAQAWVLVPFAFGVWLAHYGFHLLTGALTIVPVTQSAALDVLGWPILGEPAWRLTGVQSGAVFPLQVGSVMLGTAGSIGLALASARQVSPRRPAAVAGPWIAVVALHAVVAGWLLGQPMQMRGMEMIG